MKIIHTADWHIGRTLGANRSLLADQEYILKEFTAYLKAERPDVLIIAGDLYDRSVPAKEAVALVNEVLSEIILKLGIPTIAIAGNHDGGERLNFSSGILEKQGLYIHGLLNREVTPVVLADGEGEVAFWPLPFIKPVEYRDLHGLDKTPTYDEMYRDIIAGITPRMAAEQRHVLIAHGLILNSGSDLETIDDSVRPVEIGGVEYADVGSFEAFDYVALGHLHRPQKVRWDKVRYAGSLLKYSFSEWNQKKSVTCIELGRDGIATIRQDELPTLRDLRNISGTLAELTSLERYEDPGREDYLRASLTDETPQTNPMEKLRKVYPNVMEMAYTALSGDYNVAVKTAKIRQELDDPLALFAGFYDSIYGQEMSPEETAIITAIIKEEEVQP